MKTTVMASLTALVCAAGSAQANTISFADIIDAGTAGLAIKNGVTATAELVETGRGANSGSSGNNYSFSDDGFDEDNRTAGENGAHTNLLARSRNVDENLGAGFENSIGIRVDFSSALSMDWFYGLDLDGPGPNSSGEWMYSFGLNGSTIVTPTTEISDPSDMVVETLGLSASVGTDLGVVTPSVLEIARQTVAGETDPDDFANQVLFDYQGAELTSLFFLYGVQGDAPRNDVAGAGVTGFSFDQTTAMPVDPMDPMQPAPVPLPAPAFMLIAAMGGLGVMKRRQKA